MENRNLQPKKLNEAAERILKKVRDAEAESRELELFSSPEELSGVFDLTEGHFEADPEKSYDLYYKGIERTLKMSLPKDASISKPIRELKCILLTGKEKDPVTKLRGADSRMQNISTMEVMVDILDKWSRTSLNPMELASLLLETNKSLGHIPLEREISDYL